MAGTGRSEAEAESHSRTWDEDKEEQNEVLPGRRQRAAQAGSVLGVGGINIQSSSDSLSTSRGN